MGFQEMMLYFLLCFLSFHGLTQARPSRRVPLPQPELAPQPPLAPQPALVPQPKLAPQSALAPQPELAPQPALAPQPELAPQPAGPPQTARAANKTFNVRDFGVKGDGRTDDSKAFMAAWKAACASTGAIVLYVPKANYLLGPIKFHGPCKRVTTMIVRIEGFLTAVPDLKPYGDKDDWIEFAWINRLTVTGGGTFDGQGAYIWPYNRCDHPTDCKLLPSTLKFIGTNDSAVRDIASIDSKFFHIGVVGCNNIRLTRMRLDAPRNSRNTDGIHLERCNNVTINTLTIATGDDCISIASGNSNINVSQITCGPGHGISVGDIGKGPTEEDINNISVTDSTIHGTTNGLKIKTWRSSYGDNSVSNVTFDNIIMNSVRRPIWIDQTSCANNGTCTSTTISRPKIKDVKFSNIRGSSASMIAVSLRCSRGNPCQNVVLEDINLYRVHGGDLSRSICQNVKPNFTGVQFPHPCFSV